MRVLLLLVLLLAVVSQAAAAAVLENEVVRLEVSRQNGSITRILDKRTNTELISGPESAKLFRFLIPRPEYLARRINSWEQTLHKLEAENDFIRLHFRDLQISRLRYVFQIGTMEVPEPQLDIRVTITLRLEDDHVLATMEVDNQSVEQVTDVTFPWLGSLARASGEQQARVVLPSLSDKVLSHTADFPLADRGKRFPSLLAVSWVNYELPGASVGIETRSAPEIQDALLALSPNVLPSGSPSYWGPDGFPYIAWNFYPHIAGRAQWRSPEVVIHVHDADWQRLAGEHREWQRQRYEPSTAFDSAIGFATYRLKQEDNTPNWTYDDLPMLAEHAGLAGIRHLVITNWRQREGPGNPSPFGEIADPRLGGGKRLKELVEKLETQGVDLVFAFHPTLLSTAAAPYKERAEVRRWAVRNRRQANQQSAAYTFVTIDYPYQHRSDHYWTAIDPATAATDFLLREAERVRDEYGFRGLFLRGVGIQSFLSYNQDHGVAPQESHLVGYGRFLGGLRDLFPRGLLMSEGVNALVNHYVDAGYTWDQRANSEILALSVPWVPFSNDVEALDYEGANASFVRKILINLLVDGGDGTVQPYPDFARHLRSLAALKEATLPYYGQAEFRHHEGLTSLEASPDTRVAVFRNVTTGQVGIVLGNLSPSEQSVSFEFRAPSRPTRMRLIRLSGVEQELETASPIRVELMPYEVSVLALDGDYGR